MSLLAGPPGSLIGRSCPAGIDKTVLWDHLATPERSPRPSIAPTSSVESRSELNGQATSGDSKPGR